MSCSSGQNRIAEYLTDTLKDESGRCHMTFLFNGLHYVQDVRYFQLRYGRLADFGEYMILEAPKKIVPISLREMYGSCVVPLSCYVLEGVSLSYASRGLLLLFPDGWVDALRQKLLGLFSLLASIL